MMPETTRTAAGDDAAIQAASAAPAPASRWSRLSDDILRLVQARLAGPVDTARLAAVCASWRAFVPKLPPRLPWLILDPYTDDKAKHVYSIGDGDGGIIAPPITFPSEIAGKRLVGSYDGGWVVPSDDAAPLRIVNLFSRADMPLSAQQRKSRIVDQPAGLEVKVRRKNPPARSGIDERLVPLKVVFSGPLTSSGCILAAINDERDIVICGFAHTQQHGWTRRRFDGDAVSDITFCNGDLYCLLEFSKQLVRCEVSLTDYGMAAFGAVHWVAMPDHQVVTESSKKAGYSKYFLQLRGRLVLVVMNAKSLRLWSYHTRGPLFVVFELVGPGRSNKYKWEEVTNLGDHAVFLGPMCAKAMRISASTSERGGPQRNHIYYSHRQCFANARNVPRDAKEFFTSFDTKGGHRVYYKKEENVDNGVKGITLVGYYVLGDGHVPIWLFPPNI